MPQHPRGTVLLSLAIGIGTTLLLFFFLRSLSLLDIAITFVTTTAVAFATSYFLIRRLFVNQTDDLQQRLEDLGIKIESSQDGKQNITSTTIAASLESYILEKQREIEELKKMEAFRKDFIADVSHELKTPIFAAQGFVHTLLDGAIKEKGVRKKFLKKAAKSLDGLDMLVQDLLTLSQIETKQIKMRFEEVDLYALTEDVFEQFKGKHNKKEIALRIDGRLRKVLVLADRQRIFQVLTNFISNAIKHSEEGGEVIVSFSVRKKSVITRVKDFGEGIAPEHINRIFERFYRVDKSRSREKGGTGLGLAIVKHILDGHGTRAEVESEPGKGSTFSFKLPRARTDEHAHDREHQEKTEQGQPED